jgi:hypothetical protein
LSDTAIITWKTEKRNKANWAYWKALESNHASASPFAFRVKREREYIEKVSRGIKPCIGRVCRSIPWVDVVDAVNPLEISEETYVNRLTKEVFPTPAFPINPTI